MAAWQRSEAALSNLHPWDDVTRIWNSLKAFFKHSTQIVISFVQLEEGEEVGSLQRHNEMKRPVKVCRFSLEDEFL